MATKAEFRTVQKRFDDYKVGDVIDCSDWPNRQKLVNTGYLSQEYTTKRGS